MMSATTPVANATMFTEALAARPVLGSVVVTRNVYAGPTSSVSGGSHIWGKGDAVSTLVGMGGPASCSLLVHMNNRNAMRTVPRERQSNRGKSTTYQRWVKVLLRMVLQLSRWLSTCNNRGWDRGTVKSRGARICTYGINPAARTTCQVRHLIRQHGAGFRASGGSYVR